MICESFTVDLIFITQLAGVHCEGNPHFWVSADGSYQEEGQKNVMGKIWDKVIMDMFVNLHASLSYLIEVLTFRLF